MLLSPQAESCYVWPFCAGIDVAWKALPGILADPMHSGLLDPNDVQLLKERGAFPPVVSEVTLWTANRGGGVIRAVEVQHPSTLFLILSRFVNYVTPLGMPRRPCRGRPRVSILEAQGFRGFAPATRQQARVSYCPVRVRQLPELDDRVCWVVEHRSRGDVLDTDALVDAISGFPLSLTVNAESTALSSEQPEGGGLSSSPSILLQLDIESSIRSVNVHFAMMVYAACSLRTSLGPVIRSLTLVANIADMST